MPQLRHQAADGAPAEDKAQQLLAALRCAHLACCVTTGVADHSMDLYLDKMCNGYSWARYMRMLEMHTRPDYFQEARGVTPDENNNPRPARASRALSSGPNHCARIKFINP